MNLKNYFLLTSLIILFQSCANQLPPSGGEDDRIPPKIISVSPRPNTVNFKNNKLVFRFDEYVDRRSFEESFYIFPRPQDNVEFDWGGKEVEVIFSKLLLTDRTYIVLIGNEFKDVRGANKLETPYTFAFSTGSVIDTGKIKGKIYTNNFERIKILAYETQGKTADKLNPYGNSPDYIVQAASDGTYSFTNLSNGSYRLFAIKDEDRNNVFDEAADKIAVLSKDIIIGADSSAGSNADFLFPKKEADRSSAEFLKLLKADSVNYIHSNIAGNDKNIPSDQKLYFYFKNDELSKTDIVNNFTLRDSPGNKVYRPVFNWLNDSLLEVFSSEKFTPGSVINISIDLSGTDRRYVYSKNFSIIQNQRQGSISGKIVTGGAITGPVYVILTNKENSFISYTKRLEDSLDFKFENLPEGNYTIFSYIDKNDNGKFDEGKYFPFDPAEEFIFYEADLNLKGSWNIDNVFINY